MGRGPAVAATEEPFRAKRLVAGKEVEVRESRAGLPTLVVRTSGRTVSLHGEYDPREPARMWAGEVRAPERGVLVVLGVGLGYHVEELAARFPQARILAVEPVRELLDLCGEVLGGQGPFALPNVTVAGPDDAEAAFLRHVSLLKLQ
ncbi:MAG: hypothetical protein H5T97_02890, partial [Firmicutes bacterium]|nr:hypothetical protein [Bacillota bacterium]